ncbi:Conserved hypothetical protein [Clostridium neonatale]|nr:Conserved hypothetical protein [Clostridium neonatale]
MILIKVKDESVNYNYNYRNYIRGNINNLKVCINQIKRE